MSMEIIKWVHISCALVSGVGFFARGILMLRDSVILQARVVRAAPHVVDTVLLISAIMLASQWGWAALEQPWLLAKIAALFAYIVLGSLALRKGRPKRVRALAWVAALLVFGYIVAAALTKKTLFFL